MARILSFLARKFVSAFSNRGITDLSDDPLPKISRLYENAKRDQWNASTLLNERITTEELNNLSEEEKLSLARLVSQFYYGERAAMLVSSQLVGMVEDLEAANFLSTQCVDESRHMEVFEKLASILGGLQPINPFLELLLSDIMRAPMLEKAIGMNLVVEGLALSSFHHMVKTWQVHPKMKGNRIVIDPIEEIIRDEARHVGFGVLYLPEISRKIGIIRKIQVKVRQSLWLALLYGSVKYHQKDTQLLGLSFMDVLDKVVRDHNERIEEMGINVVVGGKKVGKALPYFDRAVNYFKVS